MKEQSKPALDLMEETARTDLRDLDPTTMWVCYGCNPGARPAVKGRSAPEGYAYIFPKNMALRRSSWEPAMSVIAAM